MIIFFPTHLHVLDYYHRTWMLCKSRVFSVQVFPCLTNSCTKRRDLLRLVLLTHFRLYLLLLSISLSAILLSFHCSLPLNSCNTILNHLNNFSINADKSVLSFESILNSNGIKARAYLIIILEGFLEGCIYLNQ